MDVEECRQDIIALINKIERLDILIYIYQFIKTKFKVG